MVVHFTVILLCGFIYPGQTKITLPDVSSIDVPSRGDSYHLNQKVNDTNILLLCANGVDDIETITLLAILRKAKINVQFSSLKNAFATILLEHDLPIVPDVDMDIVMKEQPYDMIILPGGMGYTQYYKSEPLKKLISIQDRESRYIAATSTAPLFLHHVNIGYGKHITMRPTWSNLLGSAYVLHNEIGIVQDGHILTCQGPAATMEFALHIIEIFNGEAKAREVSEMLSYRRCPGDILIVNKHDQKPVWKSRDVFVH